MSQRVRIPKASTMAAATAAMPSNFSSRNEHCSARSADASARAPVSRGTFLAAVAELERLSASKHGAALSAVCVEEEKQIDRKPQ